MPVSIGYARVSTGEQSLDLQVDALTGAGCIRIFSDRLSAKAHRPGLDEALAAMRPGDTLTVWKLDRLGRHVRGLCALLEFCDTNGLHFRSLTEGIDTTTPVGRMLFHLIAAFAQMERELIVERTHAGLAAARARGHRGGRRKKLGPNKLEAARKLFASGLSNEEVAQTLGVSLRTIYRTVPPEFRQYAPSLKPHAILHNLARSNGHAHD